MRLLLNEHRDEYSLSGLERRRLLPNFMLLDDTITLDTSMWSRDESGDFHTEVAEYQRGGRRGIIDLAPGNSFYAAGHRHVIDALEIGTGDAPAYETRRLCPNCGYGAIGEGSAPPNVSGAAASASPTAPDAAAETQLRLGFGGGRSGVRRERPTATRALQRRAVRGRRPTAHRGGVDPGRQGWLRVTCRWELPFVVFCCGELGL
ncbi:MAG: hypothetical protein IPO44_08845 [Candidatus Microthrix sp.]|nr:hypothetical protein [Candidatus Microthrix sp.]MBK9559649.1 hypothetical protein [Candidatus Microthrix sp.]